VSTTATAITVPGRLTAHAASLPKRFIIEGRLGGAGHPTP
jgi:hypothetical protein